MIAESYQDAKNLFLSGDYSVENYFQQNGYLLEYGYCKLLKGEVSNAKPVFKELARNDMRANWAGKVINFIEGYVLSIPSYFQIRNFLEIDLNLLIQAGRADYVENIINGADLFYSVNPESYKFIARVMLYNKFGEVAFQFLNRAKDKFYYDPELHLMLANCYIAMGDKVAAKKSINDCLMILPNYLPAKRLLCGL